MWLWAGPFIAAFVVIDVLVALDNWRHDRREKKGGSSRSTGGGIRRTCGGAQQRGVCRGCPRSRSPA